MNLKTNLAKRKNYGNLRDTEDIKYIVIHFTANDGDTDEGNGKYFQNNEVGASAHYFVDSDSITRSVPDDFVAWSVGGKKYFDTKGAKFYGKCNNYNSISVELCDNVKNGVYDFTPETINNAVELVKLLMSNYNVPISNVIRHYDVTGKLCPKPFVENENVWQKFKERLVENMTEEDVKQMIKESRKVYNWTTECPDWAIPTVQKLLDKGYLKGNHKGELGLSEDVLKVLVINDRAGIYN